MTELTLEALARRIEALEQRVAELGVRKKDWWRAVGISEDNEFTRLMWAETLAIREAEREAARVEREAAEEEAPIIVRMTADPS